MGIKWKDKRGSNDTGPSGALVGAESTNGAHPSDGMHRREALRRISALLGGLSISTVAGVLSGCQSGTGSGWEPETLTANQNEMIDVISKIIIPATDTPGGSAANVNRFVDAMVGKSYLPEDRDRFLTNLNGLDNRCQKKFGRPFTECSLKEQRTFIEEIDQKTFGSDGGKKGTDLTSFYRELKELVVVGYYTSEVGATQELRTNIIPGRYDGDVPYSEVGKSWSGAAL